MKELRGLKRAFVVSSDAYVMKTPAHGKKRPNSSHPRLSSTKKQKHNSALAIPGGSTRTHLSAQKHENVFSPLSVLSALPLF